MKARGRAALRARSAASTRRRRPQLESDDVVLELKTQARASSSASGWRWSTRSAASTSSRCARRSTASSAASRSPTAAWSPPIRALMTLVDLSVLEVELEIPETYAADLGLGMTAEITTARGQGERQAVGAVAGSRAQPGAGARALHRRAARRAAPEPARVGAPADRGKAQRADAAARPVRRDRRRALRLRGRGRHRRAQRRSASARPACRRSRSWKDSRKATRSSSPAATRSTTPQRVSINTSQRPTRRKERPMLRMQNLSKVYRTQMIETHALRGFEIHVREGEFVTVTGPSGSGKTTFLNIAGPARDVRRRRVHARRRRRARA